MYPDPLLVHLFIRATSTAITATATTLKLHVILYDSQVNMKRLFQVRSFSLSFFLLSILKNKIKVATCDSFKTTLHFVQIKRMIKCAGNERK